MAKVTLEDGTVLNFRGNPSAQEIEEASRQVFEEREIARGELRRLGNENPSEEQVRNLAKTGFVRNRPPLTQRLRTQAVATLPEAGQFVGGVIGMAGGSRVGAPLRGQIVGGTGGRILGEVIQKGLRGEFRDLTNAEKKRAGRELLGTAATTAAIETTTAGAGRLISGAGRGALEGLLGPRVAQRGDKVGFKRLLDPKFFEGRVPKRIALKTRKFFDKLDSVTGKGVERAVRSKAATGVKVKTAPLKQQANEALKVQGAEKIEDIFPPNTAKAQIDKVKMAKNMIDRIQQDEISIMSAWKLRRNFDKIRFGSNFSPDVTRYLDDLRNSLNAPLTRLPSVKQAFGRYSSVKTLEADLGRKFRATLIDDEIFTPQTEQFANNLLGTSKDETIRALSKLDSLLSADDRVIEDLLDVAATESLEKPLQNIGTFQRMFTEALGGRKTVAGLGAQAQRPSNAILRGLIGRALPTAATNVPEQGNLTNFDINELIPEPQNVP